jgi:hypothetical protein
MFIAWLRSHMYIADVLAPKFDPDCDHLTQHQGIPLGHIAGPSDMKHFTFLLLSASE